MSVPRFLLLAALIVSVALGLSLRGVDRLWIVLGVIVAWIAGSAVEWFSWTRTEAGRRRTPPIRDLGAYPPYVPAPRPHAGSDLETTAEQTLPRADLAATILEAPAVESGPGPFAEPISPRRRVPSFRIRRKSAPSRTDPLTGESEASRRSSVLDQGSNTTRNDRAEPPGFFGDSGVHGKKKPDVVRSIFKPRPDRYGHAESWLDGAVYLHLEAWIRPSLPNVDACKLSIDLQRQLGRFQDGPRDHAIGHVEDFVDGGFRRKKREWLDRPVLVLVREVGKHGEDVERDEPLSVDVRLTSPYRREIGAQDSRKLGVASARGLERAYELSPVLADREGDRASLRPAEVAEGRRRSPALSERPGQVIEAASEVVNNVAEPQALPSRKRRKRRYGEDEAVTVRVVFNRRGVQRLGLGVDCKGLDLSLEYLYLCYCPSPPEPGTVE